MNDGKIRKGVSFWVERWPQKIKMERNRKRKRKKDAEKKNMKKTKNGGMKRKTDGGVKLENVSRSANTAWRWINIISWKAGLHGDTCFKWLTPGLAHTFLGY